MKIALTCPAFLPATQFGGILFLCLDIARFVSKNHETTVYTTDLDFDNSVNKFNSELPKIEKYEKFVIKRNHVFFKIKLFFINPGLFFQLKKDKPDVIHAIGIRGFQAFVSAVYSKIYKIPLLLSDQGGLHTHPEYQKGAGKILNKIQEPLVKFVINQASHIIAANEYEKSVFLKYSNEKKITIVHNGIDYRNFAANNIDFKDKYNISESFILFLGRFTKIKGIDLLLLSFKKIVDKKKFQDLKLVILGANFGYEREMNSMIEKLNLKENILVIEKPTRGEVISAYHACKFLVLPSRWEMSPLTPLEGFACKKPTISTNIFGIPYVVLNNKNGLLFEPESVDDLKEKIEILLEDKELVKKLGSNGYEFVKKEYSSDNMGNQILKLYEKSQKKME
ncbi:glycosyltransferase family 4 protein [Nitrosopumilus maritimus]|uniref:Glycosyl transferase group 1 n=1 Tax=Nitrosopumilus maritimus (strain SCM1) TaxID=436308 RepID=A9A159_NITMS|nr:glycosyltransferase family 4 protein [Nitrosopumilus maritimus]ABX12020.1 glycosyl transferase group 1 [Nitrosopumilus maritimus SCM1]